jgi:hypothetical protein
MEMIRNSFKLVNAQRYENHRKPFFYLKGDLNRQAIGGQFHRLVLYIEQS